MYECDRMNHWEIINHQEYKRFKEKYFPDIVGLDKIIVTFFGIYASIEMRKQRIKRGYPPTKQTLNMVFMGNPGTGKTTIARKVARMFNDLKILSKGHLKEIDRSDLVGEYVGQTSIKTKNILEEAKGGVLFIDEAYSLYNEDYSDFGSEAIDIIVKFVEDNNDDLIVILAGYEDKITKMLKYSKGLESRFPIKITFPDYNLDELKEIFKTTLKVRGYSFTKSLEKRFGDYLRELAKNNHPELEFNGRFVRNICEEMIRKHDLKVYLNQEHIDKLMILDVDDFPK